MHSNHGFWEPDQRPGFPAQPSFPGQYGSRDFQNGPPQPAFSAFGSRDGASSANYPPEPVNGGYGYHDDRRRSDRDYQDEEQRTRRRSRSRDRDYRRSRLSPGSDSAREWDRGKPRHSSRRSPSPRRDRDSDFRDHDRNRDRKPAREDPPSKTIMLRNLPNGCFEAEVRYALGEIGTFVDIRVPRTPEGQGRGFGFVEFADVQTALNWIDKVQGAIMMGDQRVVAHFCEDRENLKRGSRDSRPSSDAPLVLPLTADWECSRCGCNNFRHRSTCFRCEATRLEAEIVHIPSADEQVGLTPCNTLLLRNLDQTTSEVMVTEALASVLKAVIPKSVKILKDPRTHMSVGYGFAQFKSLSDATDMYNALMRVNPPLTLDSKQVSLSFAKLPLSELMATFAQPTNHGASHGQRGGGGSYFPSSSNQPSEANSGAAVAALALQQLHKSQMSANIVKRQMQGQPLVHEAPYPGYQFDPSSGLYYEPSSQMYYDPKTQYFYNPATQQYLMWNAQTNSYVQVVGQTSQPGSSIAVEDEAASAAARAAEEKNRLEEEKRKQAEKVIQDMERWAKQQNQKQTPVQKRPAPPPEVRVGAVASLFKDDDGDDDQPEEQPKLNYKSISIPPKSSHPPSEPKPFPHSSSAVEEDDERRSPSPPESAAYTKHKAAEEGLIDWDRFACLLCKRQLQSKELLQKHVEMSELHLACY
ncbi:hypothetical protein RvY_05215 [Ramazzottius varieornatus]|uniref:RanBP2-type domain-containing protein n=1 Tax=Ramazzottius varieornatus TaxID=947166 RepID=A0A1D1UUD1_RAMVA|nr:hypothetical protein RvY_05215 [Ramazzottius varieornatus]